MQAGNHLVVFVKQPRLGRVKTRLAADIGAVAAWRFYRQMLRTVLPPLARDRRWRTWLAVTPDGAPGPWPVDVPIIDQGPGDLGARMARPFHVLPPGPVVIVGTDVPAVTPARIARAFRALGNHDAVFGPATDGGYWLVGLRRRPRVSDPFRGVRWSTAQALADTLANLAGLRVAFVDTLSDVDDGAAYRAWRRGGGN
ncbi:MAG: TIGR04282 family arsenosugar biosynthesis glycosyltransferase [Hyphomicrobiales bacterium]|nr:TIGR04282 family arsenosugar biosynthesis glycosyltransferase [Hyphomicrobiales bacterium]